MQKPLENRSRVSMSKISLSPKGLKQKGPMEQLFNKYQADVRNNVKF